MANLIVVPAPSCPTCGCRSTGKFALQNIETNEYLSVKLLFTDPTRIPEIWLFDTAADATRSGRMFHHTVVENT